MCVWVRACAGMRSRVCGCVCVRVRLCVCALAGDLIVLYRLVLIVSYCIVLLFHRLSLHILYAILRMRGCALLVGECGYVRAQFVFVFWFTCAQVCARVCAGMRPCVCGRVSVCVRVRRCACASTGFL